MRTAKQLLILTLPKLYLTSSAYDGKTSIDLPTSVYELGKLIETVIPDRSESSSNLTTYLVPRKSESGLTDVSSDIDAETVALSAPVAKAGPVCLPEMAELVLDYFILREGYEFSTEVDIKLKWLCSVDTDEMSGILQNERRELIDRIQTIIESVEDVAYTIDDVDEILDPEMIGNVTGGHIGRHEELESFIQALDILWFTKSSQGVIEVDLRSKIAMYIASTAPEFALKFSWVDDYTYRDHLPLSLFGSRRSTGIDYSSNMEFFKILDALKFHVESAAPVVDGLILYIQTRRRKIGKYWEMVEALDALVNFATAFMYEPENSEVFISHLKDSLEYLVKYEGSIFM